MKGAGDEEEAIQRGEDHRDPEGGGGGSQSEGFVPQAGDFGSDVLQLEGKVQRDDGVGRAAPEGTRAGEHAAQEAAGGSGARQGGAQGFAEPKMVGPQAKRQAV